MYFIFYFILPRPCSFENDLRIVCSWFVDSHTNTGVVWGMGGKLSSDCLKVELNKVLH